MDNRKYKCLLTTGGICYNLSVLIQIVHLIRRKGDDMIIIDYKDRRPIYEQIVEKYQMLIIKGVLEPDSQMPSVRSLAMELGINPNTIQRAYNMLEQSGFIYPVKGRGNFVTGGKKLAVQKQNTFLENFADSLKQAKELGITKAQLQGKIEDIYKEESND